MGNLEMKHITLIFSILPIVFAFSRFNIVYKTIKECCAGNGYFGNIVPIPADNNTNYGNCYKCCCTKLTKLEETASEFKLENDFMYVTLYQYSKEYQDGFDACNKKSAGKLDGAYFHTFRKCMAEYLTWNTALNMTKVYFVLKNSTKVALVSFPSCDGLSFDDVYIDGTREFIETNDENNKMCIGWIYERATMALRGLTNFTVEYKHSQDIFFYYKSEGFRDNYRECIKTHWAETRKTYLNIYELLKCSTKGNDYNEYMSVPESSKACVNETKHLNNYSAPMDLLDFTEVITEENKKYYGEAYICVLVKSYGHAVEEYHEDVDVFFQYLDYGGFRLPYIECMNRNRERLIPDSIQNSEVITDIKKCVNELYVEMQKNEGSQFPKLDEKWGKMFQ